MTTTSAIDTAAAWIGQMAGRSDPVIVELFRLARLGALHEEQLPKPTPRRRDGYPDNPGTEP